MSNGGIIGVVNTPTKSVASGVWTLNEVLLAQSKNIWQLPLLIDYLVVAGGGGGGASNVSGGGGAGGFRTDTAVLLNVATNYTVTVGAGGASFTSGSNSVLNTITSAGGGRGGIYPSTGAANGGSGGGAGIASSGQGTAYGAGNTPAVSPSQGNRGGTSEHVPGIGGSGGGGGGASAVGGGGTGSAPYTGGAGGAGTASSISGSSVTYAGGGGGGGNSASGSAIGPGGVGGGGNGGSSNPSIAPTSGAANQGGGGGGIASGSGGAGTGGSGVVILKYPDKFTISNPGGGLTLSTATDGEDKVTTVTAGTGNVSFA